MGGGGGYWSLKLTWNGENMWFEAFFLSLFKLKCDTKIEWVRYEDGQEVITQISLQKLSMNGAEDEGGRNQPWEQTF